VSWRLEASGAKGTNQITIEPIETVNSEHPHVRIRVASLNGEHPTMPIFPRGTIYRDRNEVQYTILNHVVAELGPVDGEMSFWIYDYLAMIGAHALVEL
jgi:hypothetical protein